MKTFSEFMDEITEAISLRKKHKGPSKRMSAGAKKDVKKRDKKKASLGIEAGGDYKLSHGKKVKKKPAERKRKIVTRG